MILEIYFPVAQPGNMSIVGQFLCFRKEQKKKFIKKTEFEKRLYITIDNKSFSYQKKKKKEI